MDCRLKIKKLSTDPTDLSFSDLWISYEQTLQLLEDGRTEDAITFVRELRIHGESNTISETLRRLISARIALKTSTASEENLSFLEKQVLVPWIPGEIEFVLGLVKYHQGLFAEGSVHFEKAEKIFSLIDFEARAAVSAFNSLIGKFYCGRISDVNTKLEHLRILEKRIRHSLEGTRWDHTRIKKVLAMVLREKAVLFETEHRVFAAIEELDKAIEIFSLEGTRSDRHLALIHAADLKLKVGDRLGALKYHDYILKPVDTRVEFPLAYLEWRLFEKEIDLNSFAVLPPTWVKRYNLCKSKAIQSDKAINSERVLKWVIQKNELIEKNLGQKWKLKAASLEGKLIRLLAKTRSSKILLSETLWPEFAKVSELDHRLHQLISRINQKYGGIIAYDGSAYKLSCSLEIE